MQKCSRLLCVHALCTRPFPTLCFLGRYLPKWAISCAFCAATPRPTHKTYILTHLAVSAVILFRFLQRCGWETHWRTSASHGNMKYSLLTSIITQFIILTLYESVYFPTKFLNDDYCQMGASWCDRTFLFDDSVSSWGSSVEGNVLTNGLFLRIVAYTACNAGKKNHLWNISMFSNGLCKAWTMWPCGILQHNTIHSSTPAAGMW